MNASSHSLHSALWPQSRQTTEEADPLRFKNKIICSFLASLSFISALNLSLKIEKFFFLNSSLKSTISMSGSCAGPILSFK